MLEVQFGAAVAAARARAGMSSAELAGRLGIAEGELALMENGARAVSLALIEGVTIALGVVPGELLGADDERALVSAWRSGGLRALLAWAAERAPSQTP